MQKPYREPMFAVLVSAGAVLILFAALLLHLAPVCSALLRLLQTLRPLLLGVLFASMLEPSYHRLHTDFTGFAERHHFRHTGWIRPVSLIGAILPPVLILVSVICLLIPQIIRSVQLISGNLGSYSETLRRWFQSYSGTALAALFPPEKLSAMLDELQDKLPDVFMKTYDYTAALVRILLDIGIGAVFALYLLADKPQIRRRLHTLCRSRRSNANLRTILRRGRLVCGTFACFLSSQCKEALILGGLCWCGMTLLRFPYPALISAVIGITNIVPYIGPLVGTVPCVLLLLLVKPSAVIWFLVYIVILQQIESNLIYPRVIGHSIGLPPAWVLAAIIIGGGLFGMAGMLLGVPAAAVLYAALFAGGRRVESAADS